MGKEKCIICKNESIRIRRNYCYSCYDKGLRKGTILRLVKPELPKILSSIQKEVLIGTLLGDGSLRRQEYSLNASLTIGRSYKDKDYLNWQYDIFKDFCSSVPRHRKVFDKRYNKWYENINFNTRNCELFNSFYDEWYPAPERKKIIPRNLKLTPLICAIWLCDDGSIMNPKLPYRFQMQLCTNGFLVEDVEFLIKLLTKRYDERFFINIDSKNHPIIKATDSATRIFLKDIDNYMPSDTMKRKSDKWRNPEHRFYENQPGRASCLPENRMGKISGMEYQVLSLIKEHKKITSKDLLPMLDIKKSNLNYILQSFEKNNYLTIEKRAAWCGGFIYSISKIGKNILKNSKIK